MGRRGQNKSKIGDMHKNRPIPQGYPHSYAKSRPLADLHTLYIVYA